MCTDPLEVMSAPRRLLKISGIYIFSCVTLECWVTDLDVDDFPCFPGNLFAVLIYHF